MIILASKSPRRQSLLKHLGVSFTVDTDDVDETIPYGMSLALAVEMLAHAKARPVADRHPASLVLAADTIVVFEDEVLGKPSSASEAIGMLQTLSGQTHEVYTGIALIRRSSAQEVITHERTRVTFGELTLDEIENYVASGSPMDKAGAYGIQDDRGALFVERIEGDYYNVVGLPVRRVYQLVNSEFADLRIF